MQPVSPLAPDAPRPGSRVRWTSLHGSARGLAIAGLVQRAGAPVLVVTGDSPAAHRIETELDFYLDGSAGLLRFPDWETLPYDLFSPHQDIVSERLDTLARLPELASGVLVTPVTTAMGRIAPRGFVAGHRFRIERGDSFDIGTFRRRLDGAGYACVSQVMEHGEYAVRGSLFDLFPMGADAPIRIDLLDDEIESLRTFDPDSQRSAGRIDRIDLLPAREFPASPEAVSGFRGAWRRRFEGDPSRCPIYREVTQGGWPAGIEYYLPLFFEETATLMDFLPPGAVVVLTEGVHDAAKAFWADTRERYESRRHDRERPVLAPNEIFMPVEELFSALAPHPRVRLRRAGESARDDTGEGGSKPGGGGGIGEGQGKPGIGGNTGEAEGKPGGGTVAFATSAPPALPIEGRAARPIGFLQDFLAAHPGRCLVVAETPGRREVLLETLGAHGLKPEIVESWSEFTAGGAGLAMTVAGLEDGACVDEPAVAVITESQLFGARAAQRRRRRGGRDPESVVRDLSELRPGAPVVHEEHGVGRYAGLEVLAVGGAQGEFLRIEYAGGDKLYVPVGSLHLVSRYTGIDPEAAPLHRLGSRQWERARRRAAERVADVAAELLEVQARRASRPGVAFEVESEFLRSFEAAFPFEETPDQAGAIEQVVADMRRPAPMDRLVCGDVGFGKTEVAMRAAFIAVQSGKQVAVLVPTTLLAQQHRQTFGDRFSDWPVRVEQLSRFRARDAQAEVVRGLAEGVVDVVIGTHKLLDGAIRFKRLGLVVIDEEHRFGVRQKERLKALRAEVDVLTLTATPIPRTLDMALSGLRDLSLIATPPAKRLSIQTFVRQWNPEMLREAFQREVRRGGQIFFVHNKVENIERIAAEVRALVPNAEARVAHGQMSERELEQTMLDFYHRRFQVLVCTTIIETGIDIPNANTIVINRADRFGLAQLHQLRGRVGRSHHRAYAYLIVPDRRAMTADAIKRLEAVESLGDLGAGFNLATHDLEIRGAGEILGDEQSGQIQEVGYALYTRLLERAVAALRAGRAPALDRPLDTGAEIDLREPALIPEDYLPDVHARLIMYKRIASARSEEALEDLMVETIDRFGPVPPAARLLFDLARLKLRATPLGVRKIETGAAGGRIVFHPEPEVDPGSVVRLVRSEPRRFRLDGSEKLRFTGDFPDAASRVDAVRKLLDALEIRAAA